MAQKLERQTYKFHNTISINAEYAIVGREEEEGPLGSLFDEVICDDNCSAKSYELSEIDLIKKCLLGVMSKADFEPNQVDMVIGGDLLDQLTATTFGVKDYGFPYWGIYGACSTFSLGLQIGAVSIEAGCADNVIVSASSHFSTSERQYRTPLELGSQSPPTAQRTVTGVGSVILSGRGNGPYVTYITKGKVIDFDQNDPFDMGTAMAPAAFDTIYNHFKATNTSFEDYDAVFTGDLASIGHDIVTRMFEEKKFKVRNYFDCGSLMYDRENQYVNAGGSGAGCCASVFCSYIMKMFRNKELSKVLFVPTGALLSPTSQQQGQTIPSIAHAVVINSKRG